MNPIDSPLRVALITDPEHPGLRPDDVCLPAAFLAEGAAVTAIPWGSDVLPEAFDLAVIRTTWDYFLRPVEFLAWVEALAMPVLNSKAVLRWNHDKRYLAALESAGFARLPRSIWLTAGERAGETRELLSELGCRRAVVKPAISGGAHGTRVVSAEAPLRWGEEERGVYLLQEFVDSVEQRGEWSLVYFGGVLSHAVLKTPRAGDFRVQDDFGGAVRFKPASDALRATGERVLAGVQAVLGRSAPLPYARVDLVEDEATGQALLMEVELIEPELFLRADPAAPGRFARAVLSAARKGLPDQALPGQALSG